MLMDHADQPQISAQMVAVLIARPFGMIYLLDLVKCQAQRSTTIGAAPARTAARSGAQ
jgi:hypothetical protein